MLYLSVEPLHTVRLAGDKELRRQLLLDRCGLAVDRSVGGAQFHVKIGSYDRAPNGGVYETGELVGGEFRLWCPMYLLITLLL